MNSSLGLAGAFASSPPFDAAASADATESGRVGDVSCEAELFLPLPPSSRVFFLRALAGLWLFDRVFSLEFMPF